MNIKTWLLIVIVLVTPVLPGLAQQATLQEEQDFRFAIQLEKKGLYDLAALQFERFADSYPMSTSAPQALFLSAQNYGKADSLARAAAIYQKLLFTYPQSDILDKSQFEYAALLERNGETLKAALTFERIKLLDANSELVPDAQIKAAQNFLRSQQFQKAYDAAAFILENHKLHPSRLQAYFTIASVHEAKGDYSQALNYLDRMLGDRLEDDLAARAYDKKAKVLMKIGRFAQADSVLSALVKGSYASPIVARAAAQLAQSMLAQRDFKAAEKTLGAALDKVDLADKPELFLKRGDLYFIQQKWQRAKEEYAKARGVPNDDSSMYFYRLGIVAKSSGDFETARQSFEQVLQDSSISNGVFRYAGFEYASALTGLGRAVEAIRFLQHVAPRFSAEHRAELYLHIAKIQQDYLGDYAGARQHFSAVIAGDPTSPLVDDAQYFYAHTFDIERDYDAALTEFQRYLTYYPGGDFYSESFDAVQRLLLLAPSRSTSDASFTNITATLGTASESGAMYNLAQHYLTVSRDYPKALALLQRTAVVNDENIDKRRLNHDLAMCHYALYEQARTDKNLAKMTENARELATLSEQMNATFASSELTEQVDYWNVRANLPELESPEQRIDYVQQHLANFSQNGRLKNSLQLILVDELIQAETDTANSRFNQAASLLEQVIASDIEDLKSAALYKKALLLNKAALADSAITVLDELVVKNDAAERASAMMLLAMLQQENGNVAEAYRLYENISTMYFYSNIARKAEIKLISLLLQQGKYHEAKLRTEKLREEGAPGELRLFYPTKMDDESRWLWANVLRRTQPPHLAIRELQRYIDLGLDMPHAAEALYAVGELADKLHKDDMALGYYEECAEHFPADSIGQQALVKTADLYFDRGDYEKAGELYVKMRELLTGDLQRLAFQQQIICEFKRKRLSRAETLVKEFKKKYDDRNAEARFLYEEGMHYVLTKNLSKAEKTFKTLGSKYDDVPEGARGELGLARLYVIQTKPEEALKRLTKIPQEYDDPEIVATAYLNLADFYYENRALENCIQAGKQVLALREDGQMRAQAIDLLINAYDDLGMRDQAVALQREYLETFPYANDVLDRRIRIGTFLYYLKEYDRAIAHLNELAPIVPADEEARVRFWIAESYAAAGLTEQAIIEYLKVRYQCKQTKLPFGVTALYKAGDGYRKLENYAKAREMYEQVIKERGATDDFGRAAGKKIQEIEAILAGQS